MTFKKSKSNDLIITLDYQRPIKLNINKKATKHKFLIEINK